MASGRVTGSAWQARNLAGCRGQSLTGPRNTRAVRGAWTCESERRGWTVERLGKPYGLRCTRTTEECQVEVKEALPAP